MSEFRYSGMDSEATRLWVTTQSVGDSARGTAVTPADDGGLYALGTTTSTSGTESVDSAAVVKLGGETQATPTATPEPTPTPTEEPTPTATPPGTEGGTTGPTGAAGDGTATTSGNGPGFGVVGTLATLGAGALVRRLWDDSREE